jgi:ATPase family associated with various cellular activities (AAA)/Winged helix domain, variant
VSDDDELERELESAAATMPATAALEALVEGFGLSPFERDVVLLCAGVELDASFAAACVAAHGDPRRTQPTFGLALAAIPHAHWSALAPDGPLRRWRLVEVSTAHALATSPLQIDERVLHYLAGVPSLDERLRGLVETIPPGPLPASHASLSERTATLWSRGRPLPVQLCGGDRAGRRAIAAAASAELRLGLLAIRAADLPTVPAEREALARIWEREAVLSGAGLLVECDEHDEPERTAAAVALVGDVNGIRLVSTPDTIASDTGTIVRVDVPPLSEEERIGLWREALGGAAEDGVETVARQFELGVHGIEAAAAQVRLGATLWDASRAQARPRLDDLAQRIEPAARWEDLVLPEPQRELLREIATHVRRRATVYDDWGWASRSARGLGIAALFSGASGTGKTMAGEVLANELELDLYRIDLSSVVSKYIGETEKNLRRVFDAAEEGGAILLFDEADALFGKRSEVKDSHDRYANIEVSYLLQRMESYRGLAILTTNQKNALDPAFMRRLRFVVQFPFPDAEQRAEIWRRVFPAETPTSGLDPDLLGRLNVAGGNIRSIALNATFLAADAATPVRMAHLLRAARSEYAKLEKPLGDSEIRGWE